VPALAVRKNTDRVRPPQITTSDRLGFRVGLGSSSRPSGFRMLAQRPARRSQRGVLLWWSARERARRSYLPRRRGRRDSCGDPAAPPLLHKLVRDFNMSLGRAERVLCDQSRPATHRGDEGLKEGHPGAQRINVTSATATATDAVGPVTITYLKASGALFAVGKATVTVTATDAYGNVSTRTFTVTVT
jgi:hypothetical protein